MADTGVGDTHQHLTGLGRCHIDLDNLKGLARGKGNGGSGFHRLFPRDVLEIGAQYRTPTSPQK
jgi:hypothetical protein